MKFGQNARRLYLRFPLLLPVNAKNSILAFISQRPCISCNELHLLKERLIQINQTATNNAMRKLKMYKRMAEIVIGASISKI
jgi:hypothetical protein